MRVTRALAFVAVLSCVGCDSPPADQAAAATHSHAGGGVVTHWTESLELFVEYPPHVRDVRSEPWAIYLTWLEDWKPVREGRLVLLLRGPGGAREEIVLQAPATPGVYAASPTLTETGTWRADLTLTARGADHAIPVGQLEVFTSEEALPHDEEQPLPGLIALPKEEQWAMPFEVAVAETRRIPNSIPVTGEVTAPASACGRGRRWRSSPRRASTIRTPACGPTSWRPSARRTGRSVCSLPAPSPSAAWRRRATTSRWPGRRSKPWEAFAPPTRTAVPTRTSTGFGVRSGA